MAGSLPAESKGEKVELSIQGDVIVKKVSREFSLPYSCEILFSLYF